MNRSTGVLLPIFSLPSKYGIGTLGKSAYDFIDFLVTTKQTYWQVLPITQTGYGNSPYSSVSSFAGNPLFIDFDILEQNNYLKKSEYDNIDFGNNNRFVNYKKLLNNKYQILKIASERIIEDKKNEIECFINDNYEYIHNYALYMSIKNKFNQNTFLEWDYDYKVYDKKTIEEFEKENKKQIQFYEIVQYMFFEQWNKLKQYANSNNIYIIGDMPIYPALDSSDVWSDSNNYLLDSEKKPILVAGCPPDAFSDEGQLWGNPIYNYDYIEKNNFDFFIKKFDYLNKLYDVIRIDHFRGFDAYYCIKYGSVNAKIGEWVHAPGKKLFEQVKLKLPNVKFIAEDLGFLTQSVHDLLDFTGYPGMKILEFGFNINDKKDDVYLPHIYKENTVAYIGTHDNETFIGWLNNLDKQTKTYVFDYLKLDNPATYHLDAIYKMYQSKSNLVIITLQDLLAMDNQARINVPSTVSDKNWSFRFVDKDFNDNTIYILKTLTEETNRENIMLKNTIIK